MGIRQGDQIHVTAYYAYEELTLVPAMYNKGNHEFGRTMPMRN